jgi:hypothetical protein
MGNHFFRFFIYFALSSFPISFSCLSPFFPNSCFCYVHTGIKLHLSPSDGTVSNIHRYLRVRGKVNVSIETTPTQSLGDDFTECTGKGNSVPCARHEGNSESGDVAPLILNGTNRGRGTICFIPRPLCSAGKESPVSIEWMLGVIQNRSGPYGEISCSCRELNHDSSYESKYVCIYMCV